MGSSAQEAALAEGESHARPLVRSEADEDLVLASLIRLVPGLASVIGKTCEILVHDLRTPEVSIVAIANGHVSGRRLGGPLIGGPTNDVALSWVSSRGDSDTREYLTTTSDGRTLKSTTTLYRDANKKPFAAVCLNLDLTVPTLLKQWSEEFLATGSTDQSTVRDDDASDVDSVLQEMIEECLGQLLIPPKMASRADRLQIVRQLDQRGAFLIRGAIKRVAKELGVSRYTIYATLERVRSDS